MNRTFHRRRRSRAVLAWLAGLMTLAFADAHAEYGLDPSYNTGQGFYIDTFMTLDGQSARFGGKHAVLPNGEIVMAGVVRLSNDTIAPFWNIGLVRYKPDGAIRAWPGPDGPYFWSSREYVVYPNLPNGGTGDTRIESVEDIAYAEGRIYVLVTRAFSVSPLDRDAAIVVFKEDGSFQQNLSVILSSVDEYARALDVQVTNLVAKPVVVTVLAERYAPGPRMVVAKYNLGSNGLLAVDGGFNGGSPLQVPITTACVGASQCNVYAGDIERPARVFGGDGMPIYVVGSVQRNGTDWDYAAAKINPNGTLDTSFGFGGVRYVAFDEPGSDRGDFGYRLDIDSGTPGLSLDTLFIAGNVQRSCKDGIGVVALTSEGGDIAGFGSNSRIVHGGSTETGAICEQDASLYVGDLVHNGNELAMAGTIASLDQGGIQRVDGALLRIEATSGNLRGLARLPAEIPGFRYGDVRLRGISHAGMGRYQLTGDITNIPFGVFNSYFSTAAIPSDRLFADGFDRNIPES